MSTPRLETIGPDIWVVGHDFFAFGIHFPGRMTVIRLADGRLWLASPIPIDDDLAAELAALGTVAFIVAPNLMHHMHVAGVLERYPDAVLHGAPGLAKKRKDLDFSAELGSQAPVAWADDIEQVFVSQIPTFNETVFLHKKSGTLIVFDLFMNVHECRGWFSRMVYWLEGTWRRPAVPRLLKILVKDRVQMRRDAEAIASWPIQRLVVAHGEMVDTDAAEVVRRELAAFGASPTPSPAEI